jgi:hypothetical protein
VNKLILTTLGLVIAIGFALGCGSGEDEATSADQAPPLTKAQFIKQADAICTEVAKEREVAAAAWAKNMKGRSEETPEKIGEAVKEIMPPLMHEEGTRLETLSAPEGDEKAVAEIIDLLEKVQQSIEQADEKIFFPSGIREFENKASGYGLKVCPTPL